ncbi:DUF4388 domain-containing protein [Meiothermus sp. QL-1]|uniref:DUF4388 domain-containing protein n=1 Tax=Meiothermus sp. QL-1 TaxID=2058095 RepID=UPI000E0AD508|nr:DUF4388 domain-containing protein [Meiothermus sp. QL-1]RDI96180.1 DUF4388 domain-containing protein [Meiothermus sp. QL-1]
MEGTFDLLGPTEILQLLAQARQTGTFRVPGGEVYLERGQPVHAQYRGKVGREGLFQILSLKEGRFRYLPGERAPQTSLEGSLESYLLEALRFLEAQIELGPFDQLEAVAQQPTSTILSPEELELLQHLRKPVSLFDLLAQTGLPNTLVQPRLNRLARLGLVRITPRAPRPARLAVGLMEGSTRARVDTQLLQAWRSYYGPFTQLEVQSKQRTLRLPAEARPNLGPRLLLSTDALVFYDLQVGQEVLAWPAL